MKFFAIAAAFVAAVAAHTSETCAVVTVTVTQHMPTLPGTVAPTSVLYPTAIAPYPSSSVEAVPGPSGTGVPDVPGVPGVPSVPVPIGTAPASGAPSGTGAYPTSSTLPEFTGAASHAQIGGMVAGVGAFAAFFL